MCEKSYANLSQLARRIIATATAFTFLCQNLAWAVCADGSTFPDGGFAIGVPPITIAGNWSSGTFTGTAGSIFVPDNSVFEHNDTRQPVTGGGHNWVFDQGSTLCKETDTGPAGGTPTAWAIPPFTAANCVLLPVVKRGPIFGNFADVPYQGGTITPTCNPALLSQPSVPNPANTRFNQLGCAISHGVASTSQTATTFLFVAGIHGGLFVLSLVNVANPVGGGDAGKIAASTDFYSDLPLGQKLTDAAVSLEGMFAVATSTRSPAIFACLNPLGDPGDPSLPIDPNFAIPPASRVKCMSVGSNVVAPRTTTFGPDNLPYFGGGTLRMYPGGSAPTAWPQCIFNGFVFPPPSPTTPIDKLKAVFNAHSATHCGNTQSTKIGSPLGGSQALISHGSYMYTSPLGGAVVQIKVTIDPVTGLSQYALRTYISGLSLVTGLGVADDLLSFMVFSDPSGVGAAGREFITKLPLCEDM
jgi:hypothetical protein